MTKPKHDETQRALQAIVDALSATPAEHQQEQLTMIATTAICMIHGTYGPTFCRGYLQGAIEELDRPNAMKIRLAVRDAGTMQ